MRSIDTKALRKAMIEADCNTIGDLSEKTGINRNTLGSYLNGEQSPSYESVAKIADALELTSEAVGQIFFALQLT